MKIHGERMKNTSSASKNKATDLGSLALKYFLNTLKGWLIFRINGLILATET